MIRERGAWPLPVMTGGGSGSGRSGAAPRPAKVAGAPPAATAVAVAVSATAAVTTVAVAVRRRAFTRIVFIGAPMVSQRVTLIAVGELNNRAATLNLGSRRSRRP